MTIKRAVTHNLLRATLIGAVVAALVVLAFSFLPAPHMGAAVAHADEPVPTTLYLPWVSRPSTTTTRTYPLGETYTMFGKGATAEAARAAESFVLWRPNVTLGYYQTTQFIPRPLAPNYLLARSRVYMQIPDGIQEGASGTLHLPRIHAGGSSDTPPQGRLIQIYLCPAERPTDRSAWDTTLHKLGQVDTLGMPVQQTFVVPLNLSEVRVPPGGELCLEARGVENFAENQELGYDVAAMDSLLEVVRPSLR